MPDAYITAAVRTPVGRAGGALADIRPDDLAAAAIAGLVGSASLPVDRIEDVILGCANQAGEDNRNVARMALLLAGLPVDIPGQTVNRLCGSGLQAVVAAAHAVRAGEGELFIAGGVESMTRAPYVMLKPGKAWDRSSPQVADTTVGWRFVNPRMRPEWTISLGETAERVARMYRIGREEQDAFALESQRRAQAAIAQGVFDGEIVGVEVRRGDRVEAITRDEPPRPDVTLEGLGRLGPAFVRGGTVTAGSSSGINDGAAALAVASALAVDELDLIELNEAFAAQALACIRELQLDPARVNVYGGAIALGHPLGASGARILTTLVHGLRRTGGRYGLATMCVGVGQGIAVVVESAGGNG
jgi:acetyl-CoA acetyltransferase family protein